MSRGPGRVERIITSTFEGNPEGAFDVEELARLVYPGIEQVEKKHRVAVLRAARKVAHRMHWGYWHSSRPSGPAVFGNKLNLQSYGFARVRAGWRSPWDTMDDLRQRLIDPKAHGSRWEWIQPGGSWWLHVEMNKAKVAGDEAHFTDLHRQLNRLLVKEYIRAGLRPPPEIMENAK
ncbi:conserved hypothetical protein [Hyphomicrobiales bacterium]|nr:conserved hypothetical protein [Hyphomicrobiales bacterium]CAH1673287.1 conserved hypothetical protein [Hyphomicrobiales bacterium]